MAVIITGNRSGVNQKHQEYRDDGKDSAWLWSLFVKEGVYRVAVRVRLLQNPCKRRFPVSVFSFLEDATSCGSS
jgi:hypothetical protein